MRAWTGWLGEERPSSTWVMRAYSQTAHDTRTSGDAAQLRLDYWPRRSLVL